MTGMLAVSIALNDSILFHSLYRALASIYRSSIIIIRSSILRPVTAKSRSLDSRASPVIIDPNISIFGDSFSNTLAATSCSFDITNSLSGFNMFKLSYILFT